jgi:hypothetical protein
LLLVGSFLIALAFYLIWPPETQARTLFFPGTTDTRLSGERRLVPRVRAGERKVYLVVEELVLGPIEIKHGRLLPRSTEVNFVAISGTTAYIDVSTDILFPGAEVRVDVTTSIAGIRDSVLYNFRWLDEVEVTIGGQVPFEPAFFLQEDVTG